MTKGKEAGLRILKKVETFGCLSNQDFQLGIVKEQENEIEIREDFPIPCTQENRNFYAQLIKSINSTLFLTKL